MVEDGRLKSINSSVTGQGEAIVKAAMTMLPAVVGGSALNTTPLPECAALAKINDNKPVSIVYEATVNYDSGANQKIKLIPSFTTKAIHADVVKAYPALPVLEFEVTYPYIARTPTVQSAPAQNGTVPLTLHQLATVNVSLKEKGKPPSWSGSVTVPTSETFTLPIPKPKLFGKRAIVLALSESGAVTSVNYSALSSAAGALNAGNSLMTGFDPSDATKAGAIKAEADVIAQTQRLAACQAKPADCK